MPLKSIYVIDGARWMPIPRAAKLLMTNMATVKAMMADGRLQWCQVPSGAYTLLVAEADVLDQRQVRGTFPKEVARRAIAATQGASERDKALRLKGAAAPAGGNGRNLGVFVPTWDPAPLPLPVAGRSRRKNQAES
ncbi:MAG: hypothetical protein ACTHM0_11255 [Sphingomonas sp.]